jgi:arginase
MSRLAIVGAPSSAGAYAPGQEQAPAALRAAGLVARLGAEDHGDVAGFRWAPDREDPRAANVEAAARVARDVASAVGRALAGGRERVLVLGGDCTVGVGSVAGLVAAHPDERVGLLYLDLHADMNIPSSSADGALDWMGVAHVLALEGTRAALAEVGPRTPLLAGHAVVLLGFDADHATAFELAMISERRVAAVGLDALAADPVAAAGSALDALAGCDRLALHFDVDVVDFLDAPLSENVERDGGIALTAALAAVATLAADPRTTTVTIAELNPDHGAADGSTVAAFAEGLATALGA